MELPALLLTPIIAWLGPSEKDWFFMLLLSLWLLHYVNRTLIFPLRIKTKGKKMPLTIVFSAIGFNGVNGFVNGFFLGYIYTPDPALSLLEINILIGLVLFAGGMIINHISDSKLIQLRTKGEGYLIPRGWLFEYISCPNHFGEIVEWVGYAIIAWNVPAISFAVWTLCNLIPRTLNHHAWYLENFADYPKSRKAVIPFLL
jgi:steroid 5-alpha reductase family enzyme